MKDEGLDRNSLPRVPVLVAPSVSEGSGRRGAAGNEIPEPALRPDPSLTLMTCPSSALRAPSPGGRRLSVKPCRADTSAETPLPRGEDGRRPGEGRVMYAS